MWITVEKDTTDSIKSFSFNTNFLISLQIRKQGELYEVEAIMLNDDGWTLKEFDSFQQAQYFKDRILFLVGGIQHKIGLLV